MASLRKDFCTLCKKNNVNSDADTWCTEYDVSLCVECNSATNAGRKDQAPFLAPINTIYQIKPSFSNTLTIPKGETFCFVDCCTLPDGNFLFLDDVKKCLCMLRNDGTFIRKVSSFEEKPYSVCFVKDDAVAVSFFVAGDQVILVNVTNGEVNKRIKFSHGCAGVSSDGQVLVISAPTEGNVIVMNLLDESKQKLEEICEGRISLMKGNIYCTNPFEHTVHCFTLNGEMLWTIEHEDIKLPLGIAFDKHGFIYIACSKRNKIVVVAPDGKSCRPILNRDNGIKAPAAIAIDIKSGIMIVGSRNHTDSLLFQL